MHELSVCVALIEQVVDVARQQDAVSVDRIVLKVGPLSGIEPDLLENAYPLAAAGTLAADAELVIESTDVIVRCSECETESQVLPNRLLCASCGGYRTQVVSGDEMILQRLEFSKSGEADRLRAPRENAHRQG